MASTLATEHQPTEAIPTVEQDEAQPPAPASEQPAHDASGTDDDITVVQRPGDSTT